MPKKKPRKAQLWQVDPSLYQTGPKANFLERYVLSTLRSLAGHTAFALALAYPIIIVCIGILYGGLVFWSAFVGSAGLIWLVIWRAGYASNFAHYDVSNRKFLGLIGGSALAVGFFLAITTLKVWAFPILAGILAVCLALAITIFSRR